VVLFSGRAKLNQTESNQHPIIYFDSICNLCNSFIRFLLKVDKNEIFRYSFLSTTIIKNHASLKKGSKTEETIILKLNDEYFFQSEAVIKIFSILTMPWNYFQSLGFFPKRMRDGIYQLVAKHRYFLFGKKNDCMLFPNNKKHLFVNG